MQNINKRYVGVNGYDPYKINVTYVDHSWVIKYVVLALIVIGIRFLCCG
jgi:hypothetical protein